MMTHFHRAGRRIAAAALLVTGLAPAHAAGPADIRGWAAIGDAGLTKVSGKADVRQTVQAGLNGSVQGNSIAGAATGGAITLGDAALSSTNGLFIMSANTGSNVAINAALNVNVTITP